MANDAVSFIRRNGKTIPIRARAAAGAVGAAGVKHGPKALRVAKGATAATAGVVVAKHVMKHHAEAKNPIKVNKKMDALGLGLSVASGVVAAATFNLGVKGFLGGAAASHAIDAAGIAANVASVKGKGRAKDRITQGAKQESRNLIIGNAIFGAGLLGSAKNRARIVSFTQKLAALGKRALVRT